jgi:type VI secretion system protein ImpJ
MPDGTAFSFPDDAPCPEPIEVAATAAQSVVHLALPVRLAGSAEIDPPGREPTGARYAAREVEVRDSVAHADGAPAPVHVAELRFRIVNGAAPRDAYVHMPIARVSSVLADGTLVLDNEFPVPCLGFGASPWLVGVVDELVGKLESIARERAAFVTGRRAQGAGDLADFMALQLCNRYLAGARHLSAQRAAHPEDLYRWMLELLGEASSFSAGDPVAPRSSPTATPSPGSASGRSSRRCGASSWSWRGRTARPCRSRSACTRAARARRRSRPVPFQRGVVLHRRAGAGGPRGDPTALPGQITIGPAEDLQSMVRSAVPGIPLRHVPTVPREIPVRRQMVYFEFDRNNEFWRRLPQSAGLAIHVTGDLREGMDMECWAVRG